MTGLEALFNGLGSLLSEFALTAQNRRALHLTEDPTAQDWWPLVAGIERLDADEQNSFRARTARLVWHSVSVVRAMAWRDIRPARAHHVYFEALWQTPGGQWFYVYLQIVRAHPGPDAPWRLHDGLVRALTPRRVYNALLAHAAVLAREFPRGLPF